MSLAASGDYACSFRPYPASLLVAILKLSMHEEEDGQDKTGYHGINHYWGFQWPLFV